MNDFARLPTQIPPRNEAAVFLRLWGEHLFWSFVFLYRAICCFTRVAVIRLIEWLFLAPVYWGEIILVLWVIILAFFIFI